MRAFKLTSWNVQWADKTLDSLSGSGRARTDAEAKVAAVREEIAALDADILFVCEGPKGEARATRYFDLVAPGYRLVTRGDPTGRQYGTLGRQWLWFLVREALFDAVAPELAPVATWQAYVREQSQERHDGGKWRASVPTFLRDAADPADMGRLGPPALQPHSHYRHPQVLRMHWQGLLVEVIGVHLKSKFVTARDPWMRWVPPKPPGGGLPSYREIEAAIAACPGYVSASVAARAKLTSEALNVRYYIERRFAQEPDPAIFVVGDVNDGPGKELIEEWFLLHDLIGSLQGDVFNARAFLNHALFDFPNELRWTVQFEDEVDPRRPPEILIDHILFTQRLTGAGKGGLRVMPRAGLVEHEVHERVTSLRPRRLATSDHRPVSVIVTAVDAAGIPLPE
jgi:hypothetical protein